MKRFYIDFAGYCVIHAENEDKAKDIFWDIVSRDDALPSNVYEINCIEEGEDYERKI